jgi:hypothetical protein
VDIARPEAGTGPSINEKRGSAVSIQVPAVTLNNGVEMPQASRLSPCSSCANGTCAGLWRQQHLAGEDPRSMAGLRTPAAG